MSVDVRCPTCHAAITLPQDPRVVDRPVLEACRCGQPILVLANPRQPDQLQVWLLATRTD